MCVVSSNSTSIFPSQFSLTNNRQIHWLTSSTPLPSHFRNFNHHQGHSRNQTSLVYMQALASLSLRQSPTHCNKFYDKLSTDQTVLEQNIEHRSGCIDHKSPSPSSSSSSMRSRRSQRGRRCPCSSCRGMISCASPGTARRNSHRCWSWARSCARPAPSPDQNCTHLMLQVI